MSGFNKVINSYEEAMNGLVDGNDNYFWWIWFVRKSQKI